MPHFFINSSNKKDMVIKVDDNENYRHIAKSLRAKVGEKLLLIDENQIQYETVVCEINAGEIITSIKNSYKSQRKLPINLNVAQSVLNSDAQLSAIQKATELGVKGI